MLHSGDGVFAVMCSVWCLPNIVSSLMAKKLHFGLTRPKNLLPLVYGVSHMPWGEFQSRFNELSSTVAFSLPLSHKALTGEEHSQQLLYTVSPISAAEAFISFRAVIGVLVASLTSLHLAQSFSFREQPAPGTFTHVPYSFHFFMTDLTEIQEDVQGLESFFVFIPT